MMLSACCVVCESKETFISILSGSLWLWLAYYAVTKTAREKCAENNFCFLLTSIRILCVVVDFSSRIFFRCFHTQLACCLFELSQFSLFFFLSLARRRNNSSFFSETFCKAYKKRVGYFSLVYVTMAIFSSGNFPCV